MLDTMLPVEGDSMGTNVENKAITTTQLFAGDEVRERDNEQAGNSGKTKANDNGNDNAAACRNSHEEPVVSAMSLLRSLNCENTDSGAEVSDDHYHRPLTDHTHQQQQQLETGPIDTEGYEQYYYCYQYEDQAQQRAKQEDQSYDGFYCPFPNIQHVGDNNNNKNNIFVSDPQQQQHQLQQIDPNASLYYYQAPFYPLAPPPQGQQAAETFYYYHQMPSTSSNFMCPPHQVPPPPLEPSHHHYQQPGKACVAQLDVSNNTNNNSKCLTSRGNRATPAPSSPLVVTDDDSDVFSDISAASSGTSGGTTKIRRPPNAFMVFAKEKRRDILYNNSHMSNKEASKLLGEMWRTLPESGRAPYQEEARLLKEEHKRMYPGYVYSPVIARRLKEERLNKRKAPTTLTISTNKVQCTSSTRQL